MICGPTSASVKKTQSICKATELMMQRWPMGGFWCSVGLMLGIYLAMAGCVKIYVELF
jgi:hypothetical protein